VTDAPSKESVTLTASVAEQMAVGLPEIVAVTVEKERPGHAAEMSVGAELDRSSNDAVPMIPAVVKAGCEG
jgi:hypothetical protein